MLINIQFAADFSSHKSLSRSCHKKNWKDDDVLTCISGLGLNVNNQLSRSGKKGTVKLKTGQAMSSFSFLETASSK